MVQDPLLYQCTDLTDKSCEWPESRPSVGPIHDHLTSQVSISEVYKVPVKVARYPDIEGVSNQCVKTPVITMELKRWKKSE